VTSQQRISVKLFIEPSTQPATADVVKVFHAWIRESRVPDVLVDVADYGHVPSGPSVLLVGHATDHVFDHSGGRPGLLVLRKRGEEPPAERLGSIVTRALASAVSFGQEPSLTGVQFLTSELELRFVDRLRTPATAEGEAAVRPELEQLAARLFPQGARVERCESEGQPLSFRVTSDEQPTLAELAARA